MVRASCGLGEDEALFRVEELAHELGKLRLASMSRGQGTRGHFMQWNRVLGCAMAAF